MLYEFEDNKFDEVLVVKINTPDATLKYAQRFKSYLTRLIENDEKKILIDCRNVNFMDSTFLGSLVFTLKKMATSGGDLKLVIGNVESPVWTMFETTRMFKVFKTFPEIETAIESFN
ncbi:MAG: hypothetical protein CVV23_06750 [Ignavibacteriae bacterium HGW-Ignavibacteriae-2]|jgi:anti-sigma B factor antagonist|nr:STAS domain-containing protein [Bacteroidota bacterium]PKL89105.1 MAG: hypothetical protein CVV23_06750 [Ignavibacteriae bacterium HGW-Ignavibacteriae-2]